MLVTVMPWRVNQINEGFTESSKTVMQATFQPNQRCAKMKASTMVIQAKKIGSIRAAL